jgi:hypothetical protein
VTSAPAEEACGRTLIRIPAHQSIAKILQSLPVRATQYLSMSSARALLSSSPATDVGNRHYVDTYGVAPSMARLSAGCIASRKCSRVSSGRRWAKSSGAPLDLMTSYERD